MTKTELPWITFVFLVFLYFFPNDSCRTALGTDVLIIWQASFEPFDKTQGRLRELVRPP